MALAALATALNGAGRHDEALVHAAEALSTMVGPQTNEDISLAWLARIDALERLGRTPEAGAAATEAARILAGRAARIDRPEWRQSFLERVPQHARITALARVLR